MRSASTDGLVRPDALDELFCLEHSRMTQPRAGDTDTVHERVARTDGKK